MNRSLVIVNVNNIKLLLGSFVKYVNWLVFELFGWNYIRSKIRLPSETKNKPPSTILFWIIGVYISICGLAFARYEISNSVLELRSSSYYTLLGSGTPKSALVLLSNIQNIQVPTKPDIFSPYTVIKSFFKSEKNMEISLPLMATTIAVDKHLDPKRGSYLFTDINTGPMIFDGLVVSGVSFDSVIAKGSSFKNAILNSSFNWSDFSNSNFENSVIDNSRLMDVGLSYTNFEGAEIRYLEIEYSVDIEGALDSSKFMTQRPYNRVPLDGGSFRGSKYGGFYVSGNDLISFENFSFSDLKRLEIGGVNFSAQDLKFIDTSFENSDLSSASFENVGFRGVDFSNSNLSKAIFNNVTIEESVLFNGSDLTKASFISSSIGTSQSAVRTDYVGPSTDYEGSFSGLNLNGAIFHFSEVLADFSYSDLSNSSFKCSILSKIDFENANLEDADFSNAVIENHSSFIGAKNININQLLKAKSLGQTFLPPELKEALIKLKPGLFNKLTREERSNYFTEGLCARE